MCLVLVPLDTRFTSSLSKDVRTLKSHFELYKRGHVYHITKCDNMSECPIKGLAAPDRARPVETCKDESHRIADPRF
jgi:hypothetical protein